MTSAAENIVRPYIIEGYDSDREAWKAQRLTGIGASEISVVLGCNGWQSILGLYHKKRGTNVIDDEPEEEPEHQRWGRLLEQAILTELTNRAGTSLAVRGPLLRSTEHRWMLATPDGLTAEDEPCEGKNLSFGYDDEDWSVGIPEKYYLQCQQQIDVTRAKRCLFGALLWGNKMIWEWVPRDQRAIDKIVVAGERFWDQVERGNEPLSDGHKDARRLLGKLAIVDAPVELYEPEMGTMLEDWRTAEKELAVVRADARAKEKRRDAYADHIAQMMGKHRQGFTATGWSFRWKESRRAGYTVAPSVSESFEIKPPK